MLFESCLGAWFRLFVWVWLVGLARLVMCFSLQRFVVAVHGQCAGGSREGKCCYALSAKLGQYKKARLQHKQVALFVQLLSKLRSSLGWGGAPIVLARSRALKQNCSWGFPMPIPDPISVDHHCSEKSGGCDFHPSPARTPRVRVTASVPY